MWYVLLTKQAQKDAKRIKAAGLSEKVGNIIATVRQDPFARPPAYEALVGNLSGYYSRRISYQHRFVYEVIPNSVTIDKITYEGTVKVLRMWTHYEGVRGD